MGAGAVRALHAPLTIAMSGGQMRNMRDGTITTVTAHHTTTCRQCSAGGAMAESVGYPCATLRALDSEDD